MLTSLLQPYELPKQSVAQRLTGLRMFAPGETATVADFEGPACIRHLYVEVPPKNLRRLILRIWWDDEAAPSVECPLPDFFGIGHDLATVNLRSLLFYVAPKYGYNCYIPMPFAKRARITVTNDSAEPFPGFYVIISVNRFREAPPPWRLHAAWRRVMPAYRRGAPLTLIEAKGDGRLLGVIYHVCKRDSDDRWTHGGSDQIFIDGDTPEPAYVYGMGGEEFCHHGWGLYPALGPYSGAHEVHPVPSVKRAEGKQAFEPHGWEQHDGGRYSMFRYFIPDPIPFRRSLRMTFGTCANEISATGYWYQTDPHTPFASIPPADKRIFGARLAEEETWQPIELGSIPVAVLGPMMPQDVRAPTDAPPWSPERPLDLGASYETDVRQPYGDVVRPPYAIRWRRCALRGGFMDLAAIHRPKAAVRARGLWNYRHLPFSTLSHQLIRVRSRKPRELLLRVGFEDRVTVWLNGKSLGVLNRPEPMIWGTQDVRLDLAEGSNDLVLSCAQERWAHWSAWGIYAQLLEPSGQIAQGLEFESFDRLDPTPERWVEPWPPDGTIPMDDFRDPLYVV